MAELEQVGHVALLEAAARNTNTDTFGAFAWAHVTGKLRRFVARMQLGSNHQTLEAAGIRVSMITNVSQIDHLRKTTPPTGGDSHWVRDTVGHPPRSVNAMFASAGYAISSDAQQQRLMRRLAGMVM